MGWVQQQQQKQKQLEQQQQQRQECLRVMDKTCEQLQRQFLLEQATATAMEQARKRDRATGSGGWSGGRRK